MSHLPFIMYMRFNRDGKIRRLCIPLFLVFPLLVALIIALSPLVLIAALIGWPFGWGKPLLFSIPAVLKVIFALKGLEIYIKKKEEQASFLLR